MKTLNLKFVYLQREDDSPKTEAYLAYLKGLLEVAGAYEITNDQERHLLFLINNFVCDQMLRNRYLMKFRHINRLNEEKLKLPINLHDRLVLKIFPCKSKF